MAQSDSTPSGSPPKPGTRKVVKKRVSIFKDPLVRTLSWVAAGLVVFYLVFMVSALVLGVLGQSGPRTVVERNEQIYEAAVIENPDDIQAWSRYISALIDTGQYTGAQDAIERAQEAVNETGTEDISTAQARLYFATERYQEGIDLADEIRGRLEAYYEEAKEQEDSPESRGAEISENYWMLLIMKAEAFVELGDTASALEQFDIYLEERPTAADILVRRGYLRAESGDTAGAEEDFRAALLYLPDDPAALEGLKQIGVAE